MTPDTLALIACIAGLTACGWSLYLLRWAKRSDQRLNAFLKAGRAALDAAQARTDRAEAACEELRKGLMRGSAVGRWHRTDNAPHSDSFYHHVLTAEGPLLLTDEAWQVARQRAAKLLVTK